MTSDPTIAYDFVANDSNHSMEVYPSRRNMWGRPTALRRNISRENGVVSPVTDLHALSEQVFVHRPARKARENFRSVAYLRSSSRHRLEQVTNHEEQSSTRVGSGLSEDDVHMSSPVEINGFGNSPM